MIKKLFIFSFLFIHLFVFSESEKTKPSVCLNMIVKNESQVMKRCIDSVLPIIDTWVIVDTGSSDGTQELIKSYMKEKGIPGELHERPWVNFAHNRTEALKLAKDKADYLLFIDADEYLVYEPSFKLPELTKDLYYFKIVHEGSSIFYDKIQLINNKLPWEWVGVLHECLSPTFERSTGSVEKVFTQYTTEGARSKNPRKYHDDAKVLETALLDEPNNSRYRFYLAQSYRDAGEDELALENFEKRAKMNGCAQETYYAMLQAALLEEKLKHPPEKFLESYMRAYQFRSTRAEPLYHIANYHNRSGNYKTAYEVAKLGLGLPVSKDFIWVHGWVNDWGLPLEASISAFWLENYEECRDISLKLLEKKDLPENVRECVQNNLGHANAKLLEKIYKGTPDK